MELIFKLLRILVHDFDVSGEMNGSYLWYARKSLVLDQLVDKPVLEYSPTHTFVEITSYLAVSWKESLTVELECSSSFKPHTF